MSVLPNAWYTQNNMVARSSPQAATSQPLGSTNAGAGVGLNTGVNTGFNPGTRTFIGTRPTRTPVTRTPMTPRTPVNPTQPSGLNLPSTFSPEWLTQYMQELQQTLAGMNQTGGGPLYNAIMSDIDQSMAPFGEYSRDALNKMSSQGILNSSITGRALGDIGSNLARERMRQSAQVRMGLQQGQQQHLSNLLMPYIQGNQGPWQVLLGLLGM